MDDLISRQAAIDYIKTQRGRPFIGITLEEAIIMMIEEVPSAQPDIVRCKDCVNRDNDWCYYHGITIEVDDFCSYGERMNDE